MVVKIDSILGATLQESLYSLTRKKIVHTRIPKVDEEVIISVAGYNVLSNNAVNILSSSITASLIMWYFGSRNE